MQNFKRPELAKRPDESGTGVFQGSIFGSLGQGRVWGFQIVGMSGSSLQGQQPHLKWLWDFQTSGSRLDREHLLSGPGLGSSVSPGGMSTSLYLCFAKRFLKRAKSVRPSQVTKLVQLPLEGFQLTV